MIQFTKKAWHLDMLFSLCGIRLGWSAVIGIIPVIGDIINIYLSLKLIKLAQNIDGGLPVTVQSKMMGNISIDFMLGLVPVLGMVAGAIYKSNSRNSLILEHYLRDRARKNVEKGLFLLDPISEANKNKGNKWFSFGSKKGGNKNTTTTAANANANTNTNPTTALPTSGGPSHNNNNNHHEINTINGGGATRPTKDQPLLVEQHPTNSNSNSNTNTGKAGHKKEKGGHKQEVFKQEEGVITPALPPR